MGMPVIIEIQSPKSETLKKTFDKTFDYLRYVDKTFSPFKKNSQVSLFNAKKLKLKDSSSDFKKIYRQCKKYQKITDGFFNAFNNGYYDPCGFVKGWAIKESANIIKRNGYKKYLVSVGGDMEIGNEYKKIGIRNPFNKNQIIKIIKVKNVGIATSGNYERGLHIYNPKNNFKKADSVASVTVIDKKIDRADVLATTAFVMGKNGIDFIQSLNAQAYIIDKHKTAMTTNGFEKFVYENN